MSESRPSTLDAGDPAAVPYEFGDRFRAFVAALERPIVFFDIESTGTDPLSDRIVEISLVRVDPASGVSSPRTWRVNPGVPAPREATEIHGISTSDLADAPKFSEIVDVLCSEIAGADLAGFAISRFDVRILQSELGRVGRNIDLSATRIIDSQVIFHRREPRDLGAALRRYRGREHVGAHGAEADTIAALEVFAGQLEAYSDLPTDVAELHVVSTASRGAYCDQGRRFVWRDNEPSFNFGRHRGRSLRWIASDPRERPYLRRLVDGSFDEDARRLVREALQGRILRRDRVSPPDSASSGTSIEE